MENAIQRAPAIEGKVIMAFALGLIGMVTWFIPIVGSPIQIVGLVLSVKSLQSTKKNLAIGALILCVAGLVLSMINASVSIYMEITG